MGCSERERCVVADILSIISIKAAVDTKVLEDYLTLNTGCTSKKEPLDHGRLVYSAYLIRSEMLLIFKGICHVPSLIFDQSQIQVEYSILKAFLILNLCILNCR